MSFESLLTEVNVANFLEQSLIFKDSGLDPSRMSMAVWESILRDVCTQQERTSLDSATIKALDQWATAQNASNLSRVLREFNDGFNLDHEKATLALFEELEAGDLNEEVPKVFRSMLEELIPIKEEHDELKAEHDELHDRLKDDLGFEIYYDEFLLKNYDRMQELKDTLSKKMYIINRLQDEYDWIDELEDIKNEMQQDHDLYL